MNQRKIGNREMIIDTLKYKIEIFYPPSAFNSSEASDIYATRIRYLREGRFY